MKGEVLYSSLMLLYPKPFRNRFGAEMLHLYRDCYPDSSAIRFWTETARDIFVSVPREWRRELCRDNGEIDYTGLVDAFMATVVVGTLLLAWGWMGATYTWKIEAERLSSGILFSLVMFANALLVGILSTFFATRSNRIDTRCLLLISSEKITAR